MAYKENVLTESDIVFASKIFVNKKSCIYHKQW